MCGQHHGDFGAYIQHSGCEFPANMKMLTVSFSQQRPVKFLPAVFFFQFSYYIYSIAAHMGSFLTLNTDLH